MLAPIAQMHRTCAMRIVQPTTPRDADTKMQYRTADGAKQVDDTTIFYSSDNAFSSVGSWVERVREYT